ncbi:MAG: serine hydrolase [Planctomycetota bacterium]
MATAQSTDVWPGATWPDADPAALGWDLKRLSEVDQMAEEIKSAACVAIHRGELVWQYGATSRNFKCHSIRKSILSVLCGELVEGDALDLDLTLAELGIDDDAGLTDQERTATARHLLQGRSGVFLPGAYESSSFDRIRPTRGSHTPGTHWFYSNWDFNAVGTIYERAAGRTPFTAFAEDLAAPLQMEDFTIDRCGYLYEEEISRHPAYLFRMSARDMARFGLLVQRRGRWRDARVVSARWLEESTRRHSEVGPPFSFTAPGFGFGYMWWVPPTESPFGLRYGEGAVEARGSGGHRLALLPAWDVVFVHRANTDDGPRVADARIDHLLRVLLTAHPDGPN